MATLNISCIYIKGRALLLARLRNFTGTEQLFGGGGTIQPNKP